MCSVLHRKLVRPLRSAYCIHFRCLLKTENRKFAIGIKSSNETAPQNVTSLPYYLKPFAQLGPDELLDGIQFRQLSCYDCVMTLKSLRVQTLLKNTNFERLSKNTAFKILCAEFEVNCHSLTPSLLISGLRSLLEIGLSPLSSCIQQVEAVVQSNMKDFTMTDLVGCLHLHTKYSEGSIQDKIIPALVWSIQNRLNEISTSSELLMLVQMFHLFDSAVRKQMEQKFQKEIVKLMTPSELTKLICILAENSMRNKPLLRSAAAHLTTKSLKPNLKETVDILYALNTLNFNDSDLLSYFTDDLANEIPLNSDPGLISGLLSACGQLAWRHSDVLEACGHWIIDNFQSCNSKEFVSYLLAIAALNYVPQDKTIIRRIFNELKTKNVSKDVWLDVVWSLAVLGEIGKEVLLTVLSKDFHQTLIEDSDFKSVKHRLKLMNLKACLKYHYPECVFSCDLYLDPEEVPKSDKSKSNKDFVVKTLGDYIPREKYVASNVNTYMGVCIDAEFILNEKGKPLPISEYGLKLKPMIAAKPLPYGSKRIALLVWLYKDFTLNEKVLAGFNALAVKLLTNEGYEVVEVQYSDFPKKASDIHRLLYLVELIKNTVSGKSKLEQSQLEKF